MKAVIMAGGLGIRFRPLTYAIPKPLIPVGKKPVLELIIKNLRKFGFNEIFMMTGYRADLIKTYFGNGAKFKAKISYVKENKPLGTAGPLKLIEAQLKEPFVVMNGDILTKLNFKKLMNFHIANGADITVGVKQREFELPYGVIETKGATIVDVKEKPKNKILINAGIYALSPQALRFIPKNKKFDMPELIKKLKSERRKVLVYNIKEYWLDLVKVEDYEDAIRDAKTHGVA